MSEKKILKAEWTLDCQGKQDYDGEIISISTRYWPSNYQSNKKVSAKCSLHLNFKDYPEYIELVSQEFEGDTEAEVKFKVEQFAQLQFDKVVGLLPKEFPQSKLGINWIRTFQVISYMIMGICIGFLLGILISLK